MGAPSRRRPAPKGRWPPPKKKVYNGKWYKTLLSQMVSSVEESAMYWAAPSGAAAPKIFLLHSESVHSKMI